MKKPEWLDGGVLLAWIFVIVTFPIQLIQYIYQKFKGYKGDFAEVGIYKWYHYTLIPLLRGMQMMLDLQKKL